MMVGWYLHKKKCQAKLPYWLVVIGWPGALAIICSLIFSMVNGYFEVWPTAFYTSIGHTGKNDVIIILSVYHNLIFSKSVRPNVTLQEFNNSFLIFINETLRR